MDHPLVTAGTCDVTMTGRSSVVVVLSQSTTCCLHSSARQVYQTTRTSEAFNHPTARTSASECSHFRIRPSFCLSLAPIKMSLKQLKSCRVDMTTIHADTQTHPRTNTAADILYHLATLGLGCRCRHDTERSAVQTV